MFPIKYILEFVSLTLLFHSVMLAQTGTIVNANSGLSNKDKTEKFKPISKGLELSLNGGSGLTLGDFSGPDQFAGRGLSFKGDLDYRWGSFGLGLNAGSFGNPVDEKLSSNLDNLQLPYSTFYTKNSWVSEYAGLGPSLKLGEKRLKSILSFKGGLLGIETPEFTSTTNVFNQERELLNYKGENLSSSFISAEIKVDYSVSKRWSFFVNAFYLRALRGVEYVYTCRNFKPFGPPPYDDVAILESRIIEKRIEIKPEIIHIGIGITYRFGSNRTPEEEEEEKDSIATSFSPYYELKTREVGHFYKINNQELRFIVKNAYRTNQELKVKVKDFRGETVMDDVAPINMHESSDQQEIYESPTGTYRFMLPLKSTSLQEGEYYTLIVLGFKTPYYLRFKLETENVEN